MRRRRSSGAGRTWLLAAGAALVVAVAVLAAVLQSGGAPRLPPAGTVPPAGPGDPFAYAPARSSQFVARATAGEAHVLFAKSPGGAIATARRVASEHRLIDAATFGTGVAPATLEGIVYLESGGIPDAIAGGDPANAAGLTQIEPSTGTALLGMRVDLAGSRR